MLAEQVSINIQPPIFTAHCDGGSRGNPGPAGYGAVVEDPQGKIVVELSAFLGVRTNNFAEYAGLLAVLAWAEDSGIKHLRVISDSLLMVNQVKGKFKVKSGDLKPMCEKARTFVPGFETFEIEHVLRGGNKQADKLANDAMDNGMKGSSQPVSLPAPTVIVANTPQPQSAQTANLFPTAAEPRKAEHSRKEYEGFVNGGVIELIGDDEIPEGTRVLVICK